MLSSQYELPDDLLEYYTDLRQELGVGAYARVVLASHKETNYKVAVKIVSKDALNGNQKIYNEINILKKLNHQNICKIFQVFENENFVYIFLEYVSGGELYDQIVTSKRLSEKDARRIFREVLSAVGYLHSNGIAHRDLKPENILIDSYKNIKIIDFGLSANPSGGLICPLSTLCGSIAYAAPEILARQDYLGNEVDVWSMGVLLFTLLAGYLPFDNHTNIQTALTCIKKAQYELPSSVSKEARNLISLMLEPDPKKRQTVWDLANHEWVKRGYGISVSWNTKIENPSIEKPFVKLLSKRYKLEESKIEKMISENLLNEITAHFNYIKIQHSSQFSKEEISASLDLDVLPNEFSWKQQFKLMNNTPKSFDFDKTNKENVKSSKSLKRKSKDAQNSPSTKKTFKIFSPAKNAEKCDETVKIKPTIMSKIADLFNYKKDYSQNGPKIMKSSGNIHIVENCDETTLKSAFETLLLEFKSSAKLFSIKFENYLFKCEKICDKRHKLVFTIEICRVPCEVMETGIMTKRIKGDSWEYKLIIDEVLTRIAKIHPIKL